MREKLESRTGLAQMALIGVLLVVGVLMLTSMGGGGGESESGSEAEPEISVTTSSPAITPAGETPSTGGPAAPPEAPPPPKAVTAAFNSGETVVLLIVRESGIDDRLVKADSEAVASIPDVTLFVVPAHKIARYASITEGVGVNSARCQPTRRPPPKGPQPAVLQPPRSATATRERRAWSRQVTDARYKGRTLSYHP